MFCKKCGKELEEKWKLCPNCGEPVEQKENHNYMVKDKVSKKEPTNEVKMEINGGELTISGQYRFTSEIFIRGSNVLVRNYMNTKSYSDPIDTKFRIPEILKIKYGRHSVIRKIHKTRYIISGVVFVLGIVSSVFYLCLIALFIAIFNFLDSREKAMEISLADSRKVYLYYIDQDDAIQIEKELMERKNKNI